MKAVLLKGYGGFDQLEYRVDVPVPALRAGEVLVKVGAAAVNNTDINTRTAWYSRGVKDGTTSVGATHGYAEAQFEDSGWTGVPLVFPRIQGADACGRIVAIGEGVDAARIGERVLIEPVFRAPVDWAPYRAVYFGSECDGAFAEFAKAPAVHAHRIESPLSDAELASFPCTYSAAENMLERTDLRAGETVLITAASGGVGSAAVQLAKRRGAVVIAVVSASKVDEITALGASKVVARQTDLLAAVGSAAVDVAVDVVGGSQFPALLEALRRGGRYAVARAIGGPKVELDLRTVYLEDLRLFGCTILDPHVFSNLVRYIERSEIEPVVSSTHPLSGIVLAQQEFLEKRRVGKIVLIPDP
jgi:NADPH:quinone reductase-like Zn-dependent oxidoreductase